MKSGAGLGSLINIFGESVFLVNSGHVQGTCKYPKSAALARHGEGYPQGQLLAAGSGSRRILGPWHRPGVGLCEIELKRVLGLCHRGSLGVSPRHRLGYDARRKAS